MLQIFKVERYALECDLCHDQGPTGMTSAEAVMLAEGRGWFTEYREENFQTHAFCPPCREKVRGFPLFSEGRGVDAIPK